MNFHSIITKISTTSDFGRCDHISINLSNFDLFLEFVLLTHLFIGSNTPIIIPITTHIYNPYSITYCTTYLLTLHGNLHSTKINLYNMILYWLHGRYKVIESKVVRSGKGGRGGEEGTAVG